MTKSRRSFLQKLALAGGAGALGTFGGLGDFSQLARGAEADDRFFVFAYFGGGWDTILGLDPRDPARFTNDNMAITRIQPGYDIIGLDDPLVRRGDLTFGPYIGELADLADDVCVVRGMSMDTLTHEVGRRRFLTGKPPSGVLARGASGSVWLSSLFGGGEPIPNLSIGVESFNPTLPSWASALRVSSSNDLVAMLKRANPLLGDHLDVEVESFLANEADCGRSRHSEILRNADGSRERVRTLIERDLQSLFDFRGSGEEMDRIRSEFGFTTGQLNSPGARAAIAAQAITSGTCRCVTISAAGGSLDTHFQNWENDQGPRQQAGFNALARLARFLKNVPYGDDGESYFDRTTIVGFSEFMRTPLINARGGRDHWLTNSCVLLGGGIQGGQAIGASSDVGMSPQPVDLMTGQVSEDGEIIYPEHVLRSLLHIAGVENDAADFRVEPIWKMLRG